MSHHIHRVVEFHQVAAFTLDVAFSDGTTQRIDFRPVLRGTLFSPLRDPAEFARVYLDSEAATLCWPSGADFDPGTLHDWPNAGAGLAALAATWPESR